MAIDLRKQVEVETLGKVLDELDYYRLLKLKPGSPIPQVEKAFASQSSAFHPDRFFGVRDPRFMKQVTVIFKKITEAYQVLKDPELKKMYDEKLGIRAGGDGRSSKSGHMDKDSLEREKAALEGESVVSDKRARKYWDLAEIAWLNEDWNGTVMNIQFALSYEKDNPVLKQRLADAKRLMEEKKKANQNPYKIKIV